MEITREVNNILVEAYEVAKKNRHEFVTAEHILYAITFQERFITVIEELEGNVEELRNKLLDYLGNHSTNMWLTHMFFYMIYFKDLVYGAKYSVLIFVWLLVLCIASSYVVNFVYKLIIKLINNLNLKNINYVNSN